MTNTEKFFVECVKRGIKNEKVEVLPDGVDHQQLYELCVSHSMSVVAFNALEKVKESLPASFFSKLQRSAHRHVMFDVQGNYDTDELLAEFERRGFKYMPLKGYHLKKLYPSTDMRYSSDCDILIDVAQLDEIRETIKELGIATDHCDEHHDVVYNPATKSVFELHKCIFVGTLETYFGVGFERARLKDGYSYFYELSPEDFYASILGHSAYHFAESAGVGIRHVTDVYLYKKTYALDYEYLDKELEKCGLLQFKNQFEKLADYFFDGAEADEFTQKLAKHVLESSVLANSEKKAASDVAAQANQEGNTKQAKTRTFWATLFPKKEWMQFSYPVLKKHVWLLPIFYFVRWFEVLFTRPERIKKLKGIQNVETEELTYMREIRDGLGIQHL